MHSCYFTIILLCIFLFSCKQEERAEKALDYKQDYDLIIKNARICSVDDDDIHPGNVVIKGDSIVFVGDVELQSIRVKSVLNAEGRLLTAGFIDAHAHGDPAITPDFENFLAMGVTTICLGQDGSSPKVNAMKSWMEAAGQEDLGVNIVMFTGHGTLRREAGIVDSIAPGQDQLTKLEELIDQAFSLGVFGISTGLEYIPGMYASEPEMETIAKKVGFHDGLIMSHMRNEDDDALEKSIRELARQGAHCKVHIAHLKSVYGKGEARAQEILNIIKEIRAQGILMSADIYPYTASYTGIGIVFPPWAKTEEGFQNALAERPDALKTYLREKVMKRNGPAATLFGTPPYAGKTLQQVAQESGKPFEEVLCDIGPRGASAAYFVMDSTLHDRLVVDPDIMISSDGSPTMLHPRGYGSFAKIIRKYVNEEQRLTLFNAIRKMTILPAETLGVEGRGRVEAGYKADLLLFHPENVQDIATFADPREYAVGIDYVIVNGKIARSKGKMKTRNGKMLKRGIK